jgi:hypothetical protein
VILILELFGYKLNWKRLEHLESSQMLMHSILVLLANNLHVVLFKQWWTRIGCMFGNSFGFWLCSHPSFDTHTNMGTSIPSTTRSKEMLPMEVNGRICPWLDRPSTGLAGLNYLNGSYSKESYVCIDWRIIWRCWAMRHTASIPFYSGTMSQFYSNAREYSPFHITCKIRQYKIPPCCVNFLSFFNCPNG